MQRTYVQRLRILFSKIGPTRYISHLDIARTWERILNRAKVPVDYSHGFNRRPKIQFATATALGSTSQCEVIDIWLQQEMAPAEVESRLEAALAPGIEIHSIANAPFSDPSLQAMTRETTFEVIITELDGADFSYLQQKILDMITADEIMRERVGKKKKVKRYNLRPLILDLALAETADQALRLMMRLVLEPGNTGRPDEVLKELGLDPLDVRIHRTEIVLDDGTELKRYR